MKSYFNRSYVWAKASTFFHTAISMKVSWVFCVVVIHDLPSQWIDYSSLVTDYHQIPMSPDDEEKTAFITPHDLYCYKVMSFGLKNVGATYQKLMTKIFKPLIGHTVEVYIDDIVVKSKTREQHVLHLQEVFHLLRKYDMKLNPSKCAFGVSADKFLGFMVN